MPKSGLVRLLVVCGSITGLIYAGKSLGPSRSNADTLDPLPAPPVKDDVPVRDEHGRPLVGELTSRTHRILIYADDDGPRYTVRSLAGEILARGLHADDVYQQFPDLDLSDLHFGSYRLGEVDSETP